MGIRHSNPCPMKKELKSLLKTAPVLIYTKMIAQQQTYLIQGVLSEYKIFPQVVRLGITPECLETERALFQLLGSAEFPMVFVAGRYIGGFQRVRKALRKGHIQKLLKKAKVEVENSENMNS